jgi:hypothetical protein
MEYQPVEPIGRPEAESNLSSGNLKLIRETLVRIAFFEKDLDWAQRRCLRFIGHPSPQVRQVAATCFGHLARIHKSRSLLSVRPVLEGLLNDPEVAGAAQAALDDMQTFIASEDAADKNAI